MRKRSDSTIILLLLLAFALRIYRLPQLSLRADEAATVFEASVEWNELVRILSNPLHQQPLYTLLLHAWMRVAGDGELAVRYLTLIGGVLLLPLVYVLSRRFFPGETRAGLWAGLLVAINPLLIWDAQDNRMYPLLAVFNIASFYFSLLLLQNRGGWRHWLGYVISTALALYTHHLAALIMLTENILWAALIWGFPQRRQRIVRWFAAQAAVALLFVPWLRMSMIMVTQFTTDFLPLVKVGEMLRRTVVGFSLGRSVDARTGVFLSVGFVLALALGLLSLARRWRKEWAPPANTLTGTQSLLILLVYLLVPILSIGAFSVLRFPIFDERYIMLSLPAYLLILGQGLDHWSASGLKRWVAALGLICILAASGYSLYNYYLVPRYMKGVNWRSYVARLLECARPGDVLIQNYPDPGLTYHLRNRMPRVLLPAGYPVDASGTEDELQRLSETYSRIWLQPQTYQEWDSEGLVEKWMNRYTLKVAEESFGSVRLSLYLPPHAYKQMLSPVQAVFQEQIRLAGYVLEAESEVQRRRLDDSSYLPAAVSLQPGERLYLTLFWQPLAHISGNYTVFVHLYDKNERIWGQKDKPPLGSSYPINRWQLRETLVDRYELVLDSPAPPGEYHLVVGMYDPVTSERLPVIGDSDILIGVDRVLLTNIQVGR